MTNINISWFIPHLQINNDNKISYIFDWMKKKKNKNP
jgi:hypothetical protein